jgi:hypothetical protein
VDSNYSVIEGCPGSDGPGFEIAVELFRAMVFYLIATLPGFSTVKRGGWLDTALQIRLRFADICVSVCTMCTVGGGPDPKVAGI